jgi:hypothetical protein
MTFSSTILPGLPSVIFPLDSLSVIREAAAQEEEEVERETSEGGGGEDEDSDPDSDQQNLEAKAQGQEGGGGKGEGETTEQESSSEEQPEEEPAVANDNNDNNNINHPPTADAGIDLTVGEGTEGVILSGSGADEDPDDTLTYLWKQVFDGEGEQPPEVRLNDAGTAQATFDAPDNVEQDTTLTFELTVSDGKEEGKDTVNVMVKDVVVTSTPNAPVTNEEEGDVTEGQVEEGESDAAVEEQEEETPESQTLPSLSSSSDEGEGEEASADDSTNPTTTDITTTTTDDASTDSNPIADNTNSTNSLEPGVQEEDDVQGSSSGKEALADDNNNNNTNTSAVTTSATTSDSTDGISPVTGNDTNTTTTLQPGLQEEDVQGITLQEGQSFAVATHFEATWNDIEDGSPQHESLHIEYTGAVGSSPIYCSTVAI